MRPVLLPVIASLVPFVMLASMAAAQPGDNGSADVATALTSDRFHFSDDQLRGLADILLAESPLVSSAWARSRSSFERVPQDLSLPDPRISYRYFAETPETRVGPQEHMLELSQALPWTGKRRLQAERSHNVAASRTWEAEDLERRLVAQLKRAYFGVAYMQEALRVNREEQEILRRFESIALTRYATGQGIQQNVVKVQTEISRLGDRETELRERLDVALRRISALIGRSDVKLSIRPIRLPLPDVVYDREDLEAFALSGHPRVNAVERKIEADRTWTRRRELETKPDFRVGLGYTSVGRRDDLAGTISPPEENGKDILTLTAGVNIPIFRKRIRAGVAEARESERANQELLSAVQDGLRFEIQEALLQAESLSERAGLYLEVIIPQAEESLASAEAAYTTDRLGFLDLLDAERVLFQSRLAYHRLVSDLWIALAGLEESTARPFPSVPQEERAGVTPETGIRP